MTADKFIINQISKADSALRRIAPYAQKYLWHMLALYHFGSEYLPLGYEMVVFIEENILPANWEALYSFLTVVGIHAALLVILFAPTLLTYISALCAFKVSRLVTAKVIALLDPVFDKVVDLTITLAKMR